MRVSFQMRILLLLITTYSLLPCIFSFHCASNKPTFVRRLFVSLRPGTLSTASVIQVHESPPSECFKQCIKNENCSAYFIDYRNSSCLLIQGISEDQLEKKLIPDENSSYHRKICLPETECDHEWVFDEILDMQLYHYLDKTVFNISSSANCMTLCLSESTFTCRSARYDASKSECILSRHDRRSAAEVFRQSPKSSSVVYLEKQCIEEPQGCLFKSRQSRAIQWRHRHVQVVNSITSKSECELACLHASPFPCRSYQYDSDPDTCLLSPEDSSSEVGPLDPLYKGTRADLENSIGGTYFEKESCVDVDIKCGPSSMSAIVRVSTPFRGRVYAVGHPYDCYSVSVSDDGHVTLAMSLHGRQCGTKNLGNGTFVNSIVVQHHPFVLRTSDRKIDVACDYEELKLKIRGAKGVKQPEMKPLAHTVTAVAPTPPIRLRVVNATDQDVTGVELGDSLFLKVELADESVYGIFGSDLVARSSGGSETVLLINDDGCPVEPTVIQALDRLPGSKSLVAPFQAFKFASDSAVKFQMTVSLCLDTCPPADCDVPSSSPTQSYGKRKRRKRRSTGSQFLDLHPGDVISDVTMESPMFLVTNLNPSLDSEQTQSGIEQRFISADHTEDLVHIKLKPNGICVTATTIYIIGAIIATIQVAIICIAAVIFLYRRDDNFQTKTRSISSKSWPSVSSRRKLVCNFS